MIRCLRQTDFITVLFYQTRCSNALVVYLRGVVWNLRLLNRWLSLRLVETEMNRILPALLVIAVLGCGVAGGQTITDPTHIDVYVTPYYNSKGPVIDVGPFSGGLAAKNEPEFVATISKMKKSWDTLNFAESVRGRDSSL